MCKAALVIAHPGHELRVFGWLETARPRIFVLTGEKPRREGQPGHPCTPGAVEVGAHPGSIYGRLTDHEAYDAMLERRTELFVALAEELGRALDDDAIATVVGDTFEGYNATHDVCRLIVDAAVALASPRRNGAIENLDFPLTGRPDDGLGPVGAPARVLNLDDRAFHRKLAAARAYVELAGG